MPDKREPVTIDGATGRVEREPAKPRARVILRRVPVPVIVREVSPAFRADVLAARIVEGVAGEVERAVKRKVRRFFRGR